MTIRSFVRYTYMYVKDRIQNIIKTCNRFYFLNYNLLTFLFI